ncbi:MAG: heme-binding protein, partial [Gammaproteobacteria bacterium]|nr:heme-binding protein [Gammaproteobacteria bacterium]
MKDFSKYMYQFAVVLVFVSPAVLQLASADDAPLTTQIQRLTMDTALTVAQATIDKCRGEGVNVAVTVVDRGGDVQIVLRDTLAMDLTLEISRQKAYTAMSFNTPTSQLVDRFTSPFSVGKVQGVLMSAGGVPINAGGTIIGGIGVSGAPSGETDELCAQAG